MGKTYKRELAVALLVWFFYIVETKEESLIEVIVWPVFTYSALAFGLDWFGKGGPVGSDPRYPSGMQWSSETTYRRRPKRSGEHPDREGELPDDRELDSPDLRDK